MNREASLYQLLCGSAQMHAHVSEILEAKALEAEKVSSWIRSTDLSGDPFKLSIQFHEQVVEVIEAITKIESGFVSHLKIFFDEDKGSEMGGDFSDLFAGGFDK